MLQLDKHDPLDRMILQELNGEPVLFDTWLDAMDKLAEESDCAQVLREHGLRAEDVLHDAQCYRVDFRNRMSKQNLPLDNRFALCTALFSKAKDNPSSELLHIYCEVLSDPGFLLEPELDLNDGDSKEQIILQHLDFCQECDQLLETLALRKDLSEKFSEAKQIRNPHPANCDTKHSYEIAKCFTKLFDLPGKGNVDILLGNLSNYIQIAAYSPNLKSIEPLLLFRLLTKHQSRMCTVPDLSINLSALWKRDNQQIDHNNGRNFKRHLLNLRFFQDLCQIYRNNESTNLPLCWYGLDQVTVLGDFYREHCSAGWEYSDRASDFPFVPTVEELVEDALFSCFHNGYEENVLFNESRLTYKELSRFQESSQPHIVAALEKISDYMNSHVTELAVQASHANADEIKTLCRSILEQANIKYQPKSIHETGLFLASINSGLMDCQDWLASYLLIQTGHALLNEPTEISEWTE